MGSTGTPLTGTEYVPDGSGFGIKENHDNNYHCEWILFCTPISDVLQSTYLWSNGAVAIICMGL
jgi:hypothetical protein